MGIFDRKSNVEKMKAKKDVDGLIKALEHKDKVVRRCAAIALGEIKDKLAVEPLIEALKDKEDEWVRINAAEALGYIGDERAAEPLTRVLEDGSEDVQKAAKKALKKIEAKKSTKNKPKKQGTVKPNIKKMKAKKDIEGLINAMKHKDFDVRWEAVEALKKIGRLATEPLIQALEDKDKGIVWLAMTTLWDIRDPGGIEALRTIEPPIEVKSRREAFSKKFPNIINHLSEMPIFGEEECNLAFQSNPKIKLPLKVKAKKLSKWGKANKDEIIDILSNGGRSPIGDYEEYPYGGLGPLDCETAELTQKPISSSIKVSIISVRSKSTERHDGYYTWDSWGGGELHLLRISEEEYRYVFDGGFVAGNVDEYVKFTIPGRKVE